MQMMTRSFQTIGLDWLLSNLAFSSTPGSATFQRTFSLFLPQVRGRSFSVLRPCPVGPRQQGQSSATAGIGKASRAQTVSGLGKRQRMDTPQGRTGGGEAQGASWQAALLRRWRGQTAIRPPKGSVGSAIRELLFGLIEDDAGGGRPDAGDAQGANSQ